VINIKKFIIFVRVYLYYSYYFYKLQFSQMGLFHVTQFNRCMTIHNLQIQYVFDCFQAIISPTIRNGFYTQAFIRQEFKEYSIHFQDAVSPYLLPTHESPKRYLLLRMPY